MKVMEANQLFDHKIDEHLALDAEIPVATSLARQGDLLFIKSDSVKPATTPVPRYGVDVVSGETGNTHKLMPTDGVMCEKFQTSATSDSYDAATITVPDGEVATMGHPEHAYVQLCPGNWIVRQQKEQFDVQRIVAD